MVGSSMGLDRRGRWIALAAAVIALLASAVAAAADAALPAPVLGQSVNVAPVSGKVMVTVPGRGSATLGSAEKIPLGSVVNASQGTVELTAADTSGNPPYSGRFSQGEFEVKQSVSGGGATQIVLLGACTKASSSSLGPLAITAKKPKPHIRRYLSITANGKFVIVGANATAYESGAASWIVNDNCDGSTSIIGRQGEVRTVARSGLTNSQLGPGESDATYCYPRTGRLKYCEDVFSDPSLNYGIFDIAIRSREKQFSFCLLRGGRTVRCSTYPLNRSLVECTLDSLPPGTYETRFTIGGTQVGILLPFITHHVRDPFGAMNYCNATS